MWSVMPVRSSQKERLWGGYAYMEGDFAQKCLESIAVWPYTSTGILGGFAGQRCPVAFVPQ